MERTKRISDVVETRIRWKKTGGGSFRFNGRIIKPGEIFLANVEDIPKAFRDQVIPLQNIEVKQTPPVVATKTVYEIQPRGKSKSLFDVVSQVGKDEKGEPIYKVLNEKVLSKEVAEKLVNDLSK